MINKFVFFFLCNKTFRCLHCVDRVKTKSNADSRADGARWCCYIVMCLRLFLFSFSFHFIRFLCVCAGVRASYASQLQHEHSVFSNSIQTNYSHFILFIQFHFIHSRVSRICLLACDFLLKIETHSYCLNRNHGELSWAVRLSISFGLIGTAQYGCVADFLLFKEYALFPKKCLHSFTFLVLAVVFCFLFVSVLFFQFFFILDSAYTLLHACFYFIA